MPLGPLLNLRNILQATDKEAYGSIHLVSTTKWLEIRKSHTTDTLLQPSPN